MGLKHVMFMVFELDSDIILQSQVKLLHANHSTYACIIVYRSDEIREPTLNHKNSPMYKK